MTDSTSHSAQQSVDPRQPDPNFIIWLKENCVSIVGVVFGALLFCLVAHYSSITINWTSTKEFTDALANMIQSVALLAGGVWAYFKFAKGRTFQDRLIPTVSSRFISINDSAFLLVTMQLRNVGLSRIAFNQELSSLGVSECIPSRAQEILTIESEWLTSFRLFGDKDKYIEPNEIVERQSLIALPQISSIGYQLELDVLSDSGYVWRATTIVDKSAFAHNEVG